MWLRALLVLVYFAVSSNSQGHWGTYSDWNYLPMYNKRDPTYMILAPRIVRPGLTYRLSVAILKAEQKELPVHVRASIRREGVEIASNYQKYYEGVPDTLLVKIPQGAREGRYKLFLEGHVEGSLDTSLFRNETELEFSQRTMSIFVQFNLALYAQGRTVLFRVVPVLPDFKPYLGTVDVYIVDPHGFEVRRWLSQQSNLGAISLSYELSGDAPEGDWQVKVIAGGYTAYEPFQVVGFDMRPLKDKPRLELFVNSPWTVLDSQEKVSVKIKALHMNNELVRGRCWVKAYVRRLMPNGTVIETPDEGEKALEIYDPVFEGLRVFDFWLSDLADLGISLMNNELVFKATVQDALINETQTGYAYSLIYNSTVKLVWLGAQPQIFKPNMPFKAYLAVTTQSGSTLDDYSGKKIRIRSSGATNMQRLKSEYSIPSDGVVKLEFTPPEHALYITLEASYDPAENDPGYRLQYGYTRQRYYEQQSYGLSGEQSRDTNINEGDPAYISSTPPQYAINTLFGQTQTATYGGLMTAQLKLVKYFSPERNFLEVTTSTLYPKVGGYIIFHVNSSFYLDDIHYVVASKGNILLVGNLPMTSRMKTFAVTLAPEMAPSSRIIVYHVKTDGELVADSLNFHVDATARNDFKVELNPLKDYSGKTVECIITGDPGSYVGMLGNENLVYSLQANGLTYAGVMANMYGFDDYANHSHTHKWTFPLQGTPDKDVYFPSRSFGIDTNQTFWFAGLLVFTDANMTILEDDCNVTAGWLRCTDARCYSIYKRCDGYLDCEDGTDESNCPQTDKIDMKRYRLSRIHQNSRHFVKYFMWKDVNIGSDGRYIFRAPIQKPPGRWFVTGFGLSRQKGFGLTEPAQVYKSRRPFFIHIEMPSVIDMGEQVGIRTIALNFQAVEIEVLLVLPKSDDYSVVKVGYQGYVDSHSPDLTEGEHQVLIWVPAKRSRKIYIPIIPRRLGKIKVTMTGLTQMGTSYHSSTFRVESGGVAVFLHTPITLDLTWSATTLLHLDINVSETNIVPHERDRLYISGSPQASVSIVGDVYGPAFYNGPLNSVDMLRLYSHCGEQNMFDFAVNIMTLRYLYQTEQLKKSDLLEVMHYMNVVYQKQLNFFTEEGGFALWMDFPQPSVWVTAFTLRYLHRAARAAEWTDLIYIDPKLFEMSMGWLLNQNQTDGSFMQTAPTYDRKIIPNNPATRYNNVSLTAYVLITLVEVNDLTGYVGTYVGAARLNAVRFLEYQLDRLKDPFEIAIVTYALSIANSVRKDEAFSMLQSIARKQDDFIYWGREAVPRTPVVLQNSIPYYGPRTLKKYDALNIETTAYALLSYSFRNHVDQKSIVKWLNNQRNHVAGFASTQDTIVALEALSTYSMKSQNRHLSHVSAQIEAAATTHWTETLKVERGQWAELQEAQIPDAWGSIRVTASGTGLALLQLAVKYTIDVQRYYLPKEPVKAFDLDLRVLYYGFNYSTVDYDICATWTLREESDRSGMAVIEVDVPNGYVVFQRELDDLVFEQQTVRNLMRADFEDDRVVLFFDYLDDTPTCFRLYAKRWYPVANMTQWYKVAVFDYYAPERYNVTMFEAFNLYVLNICQVCGSYQCPYCPDYNIASILSGSSLFVMTAIVVMLLRYLLWDNWHS